MFEDIWLPFPLFTAVAESDTADWRDSLYPLFAERCGVHAHRVIDEIAFVALTAGRARHLALSAGHPCAVVTRNAYDLAGHCVEARFARGHAHAFHYTVSIT